MRIKLFQYDDKITSKKLLGKLSQEEKEILNQFKDYLLISASQGRAEEAVRDLIRFRTVTDAHLDNITLEDLRYFLKELQELKFADYTKNKIKGYIQRFLKWKYKDWSERFSDLDDIKFNTDAQRKKPIGSDDVLSKEKIELLIRSENSLFWKTFLVVQWEGALRTGETRKLKWTDIKFDDDGFCSITVSSKKNKNATPKFREIPLKESVHYLKNLKESQRISGKMSSYVFPSHIDINKPITKAVNLWFSQLTKKVLGKPLNNYLLRHSRGTELKKLIKEGHMSKDNATEFMGHSEKMFDKVYSHMDKADVKELLKKQIYNFEEIPKEKKHEFEQEIKKLKEKLNTQGNTTSQIFEIMQLLVNNLKGGNPNYKVQDRQSNKLYSAEEAKALILEKMKQIQIA